MTLKTILYWTIISALFVTIFLPALYATVSNTRKKKYKSNDSFSFSDCLENISAYGESSDGGSGGD